MAQGSSLSQTRLQLPRALQGAWGSFYTFPALIPELAISLRILQCLLLEKGILNQPFGAGHTSNVCMSVYEPMCT